MGVGVVVGSDVAVGVPVGLGVEGAEGEAGVVGTLPGPTDPGEFAAWEVGSAPGAVHPAATISRAMPTPATRVVLTRR